MKRVENGVCPGIERIRRRHRNHANDIREVQLAKGAIAAGISLMLQEMGKNVEDIDRVIVAGAFGNYIDKESAVTIGVLPALAGEKILSAGNTAGAGVSMALASEKELELAERIPQLVKHVDLAARRTSRRLTWVRWLSAKTGGTDRMDHIDSKSMQPVKLPGSSPMKRKGCS